MKPKILVVDDNIDAADTLVELLRMYDFEALAAYSGGGALQAAEAFLPDIVLLDLRLGDTDGVDTARRLRRTGWGKTLRLIALTAWGGDDMRRRAFAAGMERHLVKPSSLEEIMHAIEHPA